MNNTLFGSQAIMVFNVICITLKTLDPQLCVLPFRIVCLYRFFGVNLKSRMFSVQCHYSKRIIKIQQNLT